MLSADWYSSFEYFGQFPVTVNLYGACQIASQPSMTQFLLSQFRFSIADTSFVFCGHSFLRAILHLLTSNSKQFTTSQTRAFPPIAGFMILPKGKAPSSHRSSKYPRYLQGPCSLQIPLQCTLIAVAQAVSSGYPNPTRYPVLMKYRVSGRVRVEISGIGSGSGTRVTRYPMIFKTESGRVG